MLWRYDVIPSSPEYVTKMLLVDATSRQTADAIVGALNKHALYHTRLDYRVEFIGVIAQDSTCVYVISR